MANRYEALQAGTPAPVDSRPVIYYNPWTTAEDGDEMRQKVKEIILSAEPKPVVNGNGRETIVAHFNPFTSAEQTKDPKEIAQRHMERRGVTIPSKNGKATLPSIE